MTRGLRGGFLCGLQFGQVLARFFIEGLNAAFAAKPNQAIPIQGIDRVAHAPQRIPGNQTDFQWVGSYLGFGLGLILRGFGEDGLQGRGLGLCIRGEGQNCGPTE